MFNWRAFECFFPCDLEYNWTASSKKDGVKERGNWNKLQLNQKNEHFSNYLDENVLLGKSDKHNDEYDTILFVSRTIQNITIPPNIRRIGQYAFSYCNCNQKVELRPDSKLEIISPNAFYRSSIEHLKIPQHVTQICNDAFSA